MVFGRCLSGGSQGEELLFFWWMRWKHIGCGSIHVGHIGFDLSYDSAAFLFWRVLHVLFLSTRYVLEQHYTRMSSIILYNATNTCP